MDEEIKEVENNWQTDQAQCSGNKMLKDVNLNKQKGNQQKW